jgi:hypothetical protein
VNQARPRGMRSLVVEQRPADPLAGSVSYSQQGDHTPVGGEHVPWPGDDGRNSENYNRRDTLARRYVEYARRCNVLQATAGVESD